MSFNADFTEHKLFSCELMTTCYRDLFSKSQEKSEVISERGILTVILEEFLLVPAKGGSSKAFVEWPDMTYFTHVLNALVISGKLLDFHFIKMNLACTENNRDLEKFVRLFFAAVSMHDADKLFHEGQEGADDLKAVLERHKQEIIMICSYYLRSLGSPDVWWNDIEYLILRTENRSMDFANGLVTNLDRSQLSTISQFTKIADQVGGIKADTTYSVFSIMKKLVDPMLESYGEELHLLHFSDLPQTLLLERLNSTIVEFLKESSRHIIANFPDAIAFVGASITEEEFIKARMKFAQKVASNDENVDDVLNNFAPSGNSIRLNFSREVESTQKVVMKYIEKFEGRLLIWSKEDWRKMNPDFDEKVRPFGIPIDRRNKDGKLFFFLRLPEGSTEEADQEIERKRLLGLVACASSVRYWLSERFAIDTTKEDEFATNKFGLDIFNGADALQKRTIEAISHAALFSDQPIERIKAEYESLCDTIASILVLDFDRSKLIDYDEFFDKALGREVIIQEPPDKSSMCIQCGVFAEVPLKEENSFGIKATSGSGRKITVLGYDEDKFNGKICKYCLRENGLRRSEIGKENESLTMQVFMGDYYVPVDLDSVVNRLREVSSRNQDMRFEQENDPNGKRKMVIRVGKRSKKDLGYHMLLFTTKPKRTVEEFYRISNILDFISKTGVKIRLTSLISSKKIFKPMFEWDNAPSWVKNQHMDRVRIDQLNSVNRELTLIYLISKISPARNAIAHVIHNLNRGKRGIFSILWRNLVSDSGVINLNKYPKVREGVEWYMEKYEKELNKPSMDKVVDEACYVVTSGPSSNNDNTWMVREAMNLYLKYFKSEDKDLKQKIAGRIWDFAKRQKFSGKEVQEHCIGFSDAFVDLMRSEFRNRIPGSDNRKDLIAQFALMFNIEKWKRIKNKKEENEKNE